MIYTAPNTLRTLDLDERIIQVKNFTDVQCVMLQAVQCSPQPHLQTLLRLSHVL